MCATIPGAHMRFIVLKFILKFGCDNIDLRVNVGRIPLKQKMITNQSKTEKEEQTEEIKIEKCLGKTKSQRKKK